MRTRCRVRIAVSAGCTTRGSSARAGHPAAALDRSEPDGRARHSQRFLGRRHRHDIRAASIDTRRSRCSSFPRSPAAAATTTAVAAEEPPAAHCPRRHSSSRSEPATVQLGQNSTLSWTSDAGNTCTASGAWTGQQPASGTRTITPTATGTQTFTLTCSGSGYSGEATRTATLTIGTCRDAGAIAGEHLHAALHALPRRLAAAQRLRCRVR